jgi:hypothetical protein
MYLLKATLHALSRVMWISLFAGRKTIESMVFIAIAGGRSSFGCVHIEVG